jgi:hypothetical protein
MTKRTTIETIIINNVSLLIERGGSYYYVTATDNSTGKVLGLHGARGLVKLGALTEELTKLYADFNPETAREEESMKDVKTINSVITQTTEDMGTLDSMGLQSGIYNVMKAKEVTMPIKSRKHTFKYTVFSPSKDGVVSTQHSFEFIQLATPITEVKHVAIDERSLATKAETEADKLNYHLGVRYPDIEEDQYEELIKLAEKNLRYSLEDHKELRDIEKTMKAINGKKYYDSNTFKATLYKRFLYGELCDKCKAKLEAGFRSFEICCPVCDMREERCCRVKYINPIEFSIDYDESLDADNVAGYVLDEYQIRGHKIYDNNFIVLSGYGTTHFTDVTDDGSKKPFMDKLVQLSNSVFVQPVKAAADVNNFKMADKIMKSGIQTGKCDVELDRTVTGMYQDYESVTAEVNARTNEDRDNERKLKEFQERIEKIHPMTVYKEVMADVLGAIESSDTIQQAWQFRSSALDLFYARIKKLNLGYISLGKAFFRKHYQTVDQAVQSKFGYESYTLAKNPEMAGMKDAYARVTNELDKIKGNDFIKRRAIISGDADISVEDAKMAIEYAKTHSSRRFSGPIYSALNSIVRANS